MFIEEVIFRQLSLKLKADGQKKTAPKTLAIQEQIDDLSTRFYNDDIDSTDLLRRRSLVVASKK
jgi:hypothetical protein